tara:strand:+ start:233 stop:490 length:258 start_codon:yes stop_codon:yes gene_type:complete
MNPLSGQPIVASLENIRYSRIMKDRERDILGYVLQEMDTRKGQLPIIAQRTKIPYRTLQKLSFRETTNPRIQMVQTLYNYFLGAD